jgi:hypothetical protein
MDHGLGGVDLSHCVIVRSLHCRRCGYDLRGLAPTGRCPECGSDVWVTIHSAVDPAGSGLPALRNPSSVGDGLLLSLVCIFIAGLGDVLRPALLGLDQLAPGGAVLARFAPPGLPLYSGLVGLMGLAGVWLLKPPPGKEPPGAVWRDIGLMAVGLACWSLLIALLGVMEVRNAGEPLRLIVRLAMCIAAIVGLLGLKGIMAVIGRRSREYRTSRGGKQSAEAMSYAFAFGILGNLVLLYEQTNPDRGVVYALGTTIVAASTLMLMIGAAYLVVNAWWIRTALRKPPPTLASLLAPDARRQRT